MAMPPKPVELLKAAGTWRADRHGGGPTAELVPLSETLAVLSPDQALAGVLDTARQWLRDSDALAVSLLASLIDERSAVQGEVRAGASKRSDLRDLDKAITSLLSDLGLTPTARSRLGVQAAQAESTMNRLARERSASAQ